MGKKFTRGTTLIELVVAMAVTTIVLSSVTALSIFAYSASFSFSKKTVVTNNLNGLKNYLRQFVDNNNGTFLSVNSNYGPDNQRCFVTKVNDIETTYSYKGSEFKTSEEVLYNSRYDFILGIESLNEAKDLYKFSFRYGTINEYILLNIYKVG
ncbi:MAG: type II secretion system protein [Bacilli bacterium]